MLAEVRQRFESDYTAGSRTPHETGLAARLWYEENILEDPAALAAETCELLDDIAQNINQWDQNDRDNVTLLFQVIAGEAESLPTLDKQQQFAIAESYIGCVGALSKEEDWLGSPWTLVEVGQSLNKILGTEKDFVTGMQARGLLNESWNNYSANVSLNSPDSKLERTLFDDSFKKMLATMQESFLPRREEVNEKGIERSAPELSGTQAALMAWYGEKVRGNGSAKLAILRACPEYRAEIKNAKNADIADFWNIYKPEEAGPQIQKLLENQMIRTHFEERFDAIFSEKLEHTTEDEQRALTDAMVGIMREVYGSLSASIVNYDTVRDRILGQVAQAKGMSNSRKKLKPVKKWLRQISEEIPDDPGEIEAFIAANEPQLRQLHDAKVKPKYQALQEIETSVGALPSRAFSLMNRDMYDVTSGNLTADCTAWNMDLGFNAWTIPAWVNNPAFNFAYIHSPNNTMIAKFGLILATDNEGKPQVVIDSIETNKNMDTADENTALLDIYSGFADLQAWADERGFGTLRVCTYTNSTELTAELPIMNEFDKTEAGRTFTYDGMRAVREILAHLSAEKQGDDLTIYLQSNFYDEDEENEIPGNVEGVEEFESMLQRAISLTNNPAVPISEEELLDNMRSGSREKIMMGFITCFAPKLASNFNFTYHDIERLYHDIEAHSRSYAPFALSKDDLATTGFAWLLGIDYPDEVLPGFSDLTYTGEPVEAEQDEEFYLSDEEETIYIPPATERAPYYQYRDEFLNFFESMEYKNFDFESAALHVLGVQEAHAEHRDARSKDTIVLSKLPVYDRKAV